MSYQVIARKYRPQRFADVVGQEHVTTTLANAIASGRIAHAYLFCGPRGTGKTTLARIFAKCLNCTGGPKADFPEDDPRAQEIAEGRALDVLEIDGASNNGVEQVRELRDTARFAPAHGKFKIYIIDEVHMLSAAAFNALLKTLEEPPAHVKFLFATTDPEKVLPTILSRCQRFDLRRIPSALIVAQLSRIAAAEGVEAEPAALDAIARGADGGMRDAQSTLDQLISFCGRRLVEADVLSMFGLAGRAQLRAIAAGILNADKAAVLREFDGLARGGKDLGRLLGDLLSHFRNLLLWVVSKGDRSLIEASEADIESISAQAAHLDADAITRVLDVLSAAEGRLRDAASKRIFLEVALLKAIQARSAVGIDAVLRQLKALREGLPPAAASAATPTVPSHAPPPADVAPPTPAKPAPPSPAPTSPAPAPTPPRAVAAPTSTQSLDDVWQSLLRALSADDGLLVANLAHCSPVSLERGTLRIRHPEGDMLDTPRTIATLKARLMAATGQALDVTFEAAPAGAPVPPSTRAGTGVPPRATPAPDSAPSTPPPGTFAASDVAAPPTPPSPSPKPRVPPPPAAPAPGTPALLSKEEFLNDPAIRMALDVFKGQIVEVRAPGP